MTLLNRLSGGWFNYVHGNNLVYNTCWEDPRLDRQAMRLGADDTVLVITSAGCNALDYALDGPKRIHAVDMNPRQNALLELKLAGIKTLDYEDFFSLFGRGRLNDSQQVYQAHIRSELSPAARGYWDRNIGFFAGNRDRQSFYYRGTSGAFARCVNWYIDFVAQVRDGVKAILDAPTLAEQQKIYESGLKEAFWSRFLRWLVERDSTLSMVGVPLAQRQQVERHYTGGIARFIEDCIDAVFSQLPLCDNYFWRVYLTGQYTPECCPQYLRRENFLRLKGGLAERISVHTSSVTGFLEQHTAPITRFVLLDHMDWLSSQGNALLQREWEMIFRRGATNSQVLYRSGGLHAEFVDSLEVNAHGRKQQVGELLAYDRPLANRLHPQDRVHTYGSFHIAQFAGQG